MTAAVKERNRLDAGDGVFVSHRPAPARSGTRTARTRPTRRTAKPKLRVLNQQAIRQRARRRNALLALFIVVLIGFFAVALIQAQLVADQQDLDVLRARIAKVEADNAAMTREVETASSPAAIVGRATELGMVRAYQPIYLEAVAPVREVPNAPVFDPEADHRFELAAPQAASVDSLTTGVSSRASVAPASAEIAAAPEGQRSVPAGTDVPAAATRSGQTPSPGLVGTVATATSGDSAQAAGTTAATVAPATVTGLVAGGLGHTTTDDGGTALTDGGSRFAGTRAVTGGPGSG